MKPKGKSFHRPFALDQSPDAKRMRKIKRTHDGVTYGSILEANYAAYLDGLIQTETATFEFWLRQVPFRLGKDFVYRADFVLFEHDGNVFAVDVKGMETREFRRTLKLWKKYGPMPLHIVTWKRKQWCTEVIEREL